MDRDSFIEDLDLALAALRRIILRAVDVDPAAPVMLRPQPAPSIPQGRAQQPCLVPGSKPAAPPPAPVDRPTAAIVESNGVSVNLNTNTITFCRESVTVGVRAAQAVVVLARAMPNVVPRAEIARRGFPDLSSDSGNTTLSAMKDKLAAQLSEIGLRLNIVVGFGWALCVADDGEGDDAGES